MEIDKDIDLLIEESFMGEMSPDRKEVLRRWLEADEEHRKYYERRILLYRWLRIQSWMPFFEKEQKKACRRFLSRVHAADVRRPVAVGKHRRQWLSVAAALLLVLGSGVMLWRKATGMDGAEQSCALPQTVNVPEGMKYRMVLADGSHVWLNSGSSMVLNAGFGQTNRELTLEGEGLFEVTKNGQLPFIIHSGDICVRVTGTVFNFKAYSNDRFAKVTLLRGSLDVSTEHDAVSRTVALSPNEQVVVDRYNDVLEKEEAEAATDVAWTNVGDRGDAGNTGSAGSMNAGSLGTDALFFDELSMAEIMRRLEQAFHVCIKVEYPGLLEKKYYGDFRGKKDVFDILDVMVRGESVTYRIKGDTIFVTE